jgi:hypothetical protein
MHSLSADVLSHIGSFLNPSDVVALSHVTQVIKTKSDQMLISKAQETFGEINQSLQLDLHHIARLLYCTDKVPNPNVNYGKFIRERSACLKNSLDEEVAENYNKAIDFLRNTQATSLVQLKNKITAFWHIIKADDDYEGKSVVYPLSRRLP